MQGIQANFNLYAENVERAVNFYRKNFDFKHLGNIDESESTDWAALKLENTIIWLGKNGSSVGLILLILSELQTLINRLKEKGVKFIIPEEMNIGSPISEEVIKTNWGKHAWFIDSEKNVVMLFEPTN
ncbi:hypothetical protein H8E88_07260 [candidate division KSB1 bacterium]|nr:hypothetical protein [candidate division KSB1 bacterium]MBL7093906.1 hypothetical protein [candidate division KSB1 bacterium]